MVGFVGRRRELQTIDRAVKRMTAGEGGIVEIRGEPGIGKTRLLYEAGQRAARSGVRVTTGSTGELERDVPFGVFVDALDDDVAQLFAPPT
jgi:predicted ATPase